MLAGPTVRRLHRERGGLSSSEIQVKRRRRGAAPQLRPASPPRPRERVCAADLASVPSTQSGFPFGMKSLLRMEQYPDVVVLDGEIVHITWKGARRGEDQVALNRTRARARPGGSLKQRLQQAYQTHREAVRQWVQVNGPGSRHAGLDAGRQPLRTQLSNSIGRFVHTKLIPRLEKEAGGQSREPRPQPETPRPSTPPAGPVALPGVDVLDSGRWWAFHGDCWYQLVPFGGSRSPGRLHLTVGQQEFAEWRRTRRGWMLDRQNRRLERSMVEAVGPSARGAEVVARTYDNGLHAVVQTAMGRLWVTLRVPPYAVEGENRRLYRFGAVEIGICLTGDRASDVIHGSAACVTHPYDHMFVLGGDSGSPICMPRSAQYYRRLHRLPLAEAILRHLEAARVTLCSGLYSQSWSTPYHPIASVAQGQISTTEARRLQLPVYRYYRN